MIPKTSQQRTAATSAIPDLTASLASIVGVPNLLVDDEALRIYSSNVSGLERAIAGVIRPADAAQVQDVVRLCRKGSIPLYPISRGGNWGMGSRLPVRDGFILDLGRMNRIREIDLTHGVAVIEPGVTQRQLYAELETLKAAYFVDVTGSSSTTSVVGNAIDRGVGYFAQRTASLRNLEVVLGSGERIQTGFGHIADARCVNLYPYGIGPDLTGLFMQSNFGVVTAAAVELRPRTASHAAMLAAIDDEHDLVRFVDRLAQLRRRDILRTAVHIGGRSRLQSTVVPLIYRALRDDGLTVADAIAEAERIAASEVRASWSAVCGLWGTADEITAVKKEVRRALRGIASVRFLTRRDVELGQRILARLGFVRALRRKHVYLRAMRPVFGLTYGVPTDATMPSVDWCVVREQLAQGIDPRAAPENPDQGYAGLLYCLPIIPLEGIAARELIDSVEETLGRCGFPPYVTFNMVNRQALECVINVSFDRRDPGQTQRAHEAIDALFDRCMRAGLVPYRVGIQHMERLVDPNSAHWQLVKQLKSVFDPDGIIAPGRYGLT